ncbi:hypothetical protein BC332_16779 [Capsicum chinense]|nr:hypothetical protein BC332_16779 [Capsicum chinense]
MVSSKQPTGSLPPIGNKRPSSSSDDVPPFSKHPEHQGKWVAFLDRKGSGHVQVNGKTISKYSFCFLNSGDEVVLSQAENNAYLLLESPADVGTSAGKGKPLNIENQVEDALAICNAPENGSRSVTWCLRL